MASELYTGYTDISKNLQEMASQRALDQARGIQSMSTMQDMARKAQEEQERQQMLERLGQYANPQMVQQQVPGMVANPQFGMTDPTASYFEGKVGQTGDSLYNGDAQPAQIPGTVMQNTLAPMAPAVGTGQIQADMVWKLEQERIKQNQLNEYTKITAHADRYLSQLKGLDDSDVGKNNKKKIYDAVKKGSIGILIKNMMM
jgi:hypothetical protein